MAGSIGKGFPTSNIQIGHVFCDSDDLTYWKFLGGDPRLVTSWVLVHGVVQTQPDTSLWGLPQGGAFWFYAPEQTYYGWDGRQLVRIAFVGSESLYDYRYMAMWQEDFLTGGNSSNVVGWLGFSSGAGTIVGQSSETNRPGIFRLGSTAAAGTIGRLTFNLAAIIIFPSNFELIWIVRLNDIDTDTTTRVGLSGSPATNPPTDGQYFEKLTGDTNWFCVSFESGVATRTDSGVQITAEFITCRIKHVNGTRIEFYLNNTLVRTAIVSSIPIAGPFMQIVNAVAVAKTIDVDYFQLIMENLERS